MDVMAPPVIWVEDRCYRLCESQSSSSENKDIPISENISRESRGKECSNFDEETSVAESFVECVENCGQNDETPAADVGVALVQKHRSEEVIPMEDSNVPSVEKCEETEKNPLMTNNGALVEKCGEKEENFSKNDNEVLVEKFGEKEENFSKNDNEVLVEKRGENEENFSINNNGVLVEKRGEKEETPLIRSAEVFVEKSRNAEEIPFVENIVASVAACRNEEKTALINGNLCDDTRKSEEKIASINGDISNEKQRNKAETPFRNSDAIANERSNEKKNLPDILVVSNGKGRYSHSFHIPKVFMPRIMGSRGTYLMELEYETQTSICIPRARDNGDTVITGSTVELVKASRRRLDELIASFKLVNLNDIGTRGRFTHFISIPIIDASVTSNYEKFKSVVLYETAKDSRGVNEGFFKKSEKLHLSLGMLLLEKYNVMRAAVRALEECNDRIVIPIIQQNGAVKMKVQGLCIRDSERATSGKVLCAKVTSENNILEELAEKISRYFIDIGLMHEPREKLQLQVTLMEAPDAVYRTHRHSQSQETFCPNEILTRHENYFFGEIFLKSIRLSQRGNYDANGYYDTRAKIHLID